jgi:hypothetical protein
MLSHVSHTNRRRLRAELLIEWLNGTKGLAANKRVIDLIKTFQKLDQANLAEFPRARLFPQSRLRSTAAQRANARKFMALRRGLKRQLKRYSFAPEQERTLHGKWIVSWKHSSKAGATPIVVSVQGDEVTVNEGDAVLAFFRLGEEGCSDLVRECRLCSKWLIGRFKHQQFCSTKCQQQSYKSSDAWKEHRRRWMWDYRKKIAARDLARIRLARTS